MGLFDSGNIKRKAETICSLFGQLESLINSHRGVNDINYYSVTSTISRIRSEYGYMQEPLLNMGYRSRASLQLRWTDGRSYDFMFWEGCYNLSLTQAKEIVNKYRHTYDIK